MKVKVIYWKGLLLKCHDLLIINNSKCMAYDQKVFQRTCSELRCIRQYSGSFGLDFGLRRHFVVTKFTENVQSQKGLHTGLFVYILVDMDGVVLSGDLQG